MSQQQATQPIVLKQENGEVVLKLVLENPKQETQALTLSNPQDNKVYLDLNHSTDWVAIGAILLSFFSFVLTALIVHKSTKAQIANNNDLIRSQIDLKTKELKINTKSQELKELREIIKRYVSSGITFRYFYIQSHEYSSFKQGVDKDKEFFKAELNTKKIEFGEASYSLFVHFDFFNDKHREMHLEMLDLLSIVSVMIENEDNKDKFNSNLKSFIEKFERISNVLKIFLQQENMNNKGE